MARRRYQQEPENHERWLVSYADFITLLFAFFVVMYAVSSVNEGKMRVLSDSLVATFASRNKSLSPIQVGKLVRSRHTDELSPITKPLMPPPIVNPRMLPDGSIVDDGTSPEGDADANKKGNGNKRGFGGQGGSEMADVGAVAAEVESKLSELIDNDDVKVRRKKNHIEIEFKSSLLFSSGTATVSAEATDVFGELVTLLKDFPNPIKVEGFTDNVPIKTKLFASNWALSATRAASVVDLFTTLGVRPDRLSAIGYGEHRPIADNETAQGRSKNRRVVLVIPATQDEGRLDDLNRLAANSAADEEPAQVEPAGSSGVESEEDDAEVDDPNAVKPWAEAPAELE